MSQNAAAPENPRYEVAVFVIDETVKLVDDLDTTMVSFSKKYVASNVSKQDEQKMRKVFGMVFNSSTNFDPKNPKPPCGTIQKDYLIRGLNQRIRTLAEEVISERARLKVDKSEPNVYVDGLIRRQNMFVEVVNALQHNKCAQYMDVRMYENGDVVLNSKEFGDLFTQFTALVLNNLDKQPQIQDILTKQDAPKQGISYEGTSKLLSVEGLLKKIQDKKVDSVDDDRVTGLLQGLEDVLKLINTQGGGGSGSGRRRWRRRKGRTEGAKDTRTGGCWSPKGAKNTGDAILDKFAKLINGSSSTIEITNGQVRGKNVAFGFSPASTFFVSVKDDYYFMNTNKGFFRVDKKDITKAEDLYDELESIIQAGKTKRPSSRETDMFGKK